MNMAVQQSGIEHGFRDNWGQFDDRGYSMEVIYSSSDLDYVSEDKKTLQVGMQEEESCGSGWKHFLLSDLKIYFDQTRG